MATRKVLDKNDDLPIRTESPVHSGKVRAVYSIGNAEAEIIEAEIMKTSILENKLLRDIEWPDGSIVCGVLQKSKFVAPKGDTKFMAGDLVAVLTLSKDIQQIEKYFQVGIGYFGK